MLEKQAIQKHKISIQYCKSCDTHNWCTHHNQQKYRQAYDDLSNYLRKQFPNLQILGNQAPPYLVPIKAKENKFFDTRSKKYVLFPAVGAFQVYFNNYLLFSKKNTNTWPNNDEILNLIHIHINKQANKSVKQNSIHSTQKHYISQKQQKQTVKMANNILMNIQNSHIKDKSKKQFTLTDHFKRYKMRKNVQQGLQSLYAQSENGRYGRISKITPEDIQKLDQIWGKKQNLPSFIKHKALIQSRQGKRQMLVNLSSIQQQSQLKQMRVQVPKSRKSKLSNLQMQFQKLENKFTKIQNRVSQVNNKNFQLNDFSRFHDKRKSDFMKPNLAGKISQVKTTYNPQKMLKQIKNKKKRKIEQYLHYTSQQKNQRLQEIYGPQFLKANLTNSKFNYSKKLNNEDWRENSKNMSNKSNSSDKSENTQSDSFNQDQEQTFNRITPKKKDAYSSHASDLRKQLSSTQNNFKAVAPKRKIYTRQKQASYPKNLNSNLNIFEKQRRLFQNRSVLHKNSQQLKNNIDKPITLNSNNQNEDNQKQQYKQNKNRSLQPASQLKGLKSLNQAQQNTLARSAQKKIQLKKSGKNKNKQSRIKKIQQKQKQVLEIYGEQQKTHKKNSKYQQIKRKRVKDNIKNDSYSQEEQSQMQNSNISSKSSKISNSLYFKNSNSNQKVVKNNSKIRQRQCQDVQKSPNLNNNNKSNLQQNRSFCSNRSKSNKSYNTINSHKSKRSKRLESQKNNANQRLSQQVKINNKKLQKKQRKYNSKIHKLQSPGQIRGNSTQNKSQVNTKQIVNQRQKTVMSQKSQKTQRNQRSYTSQKSERQKQSKISQKSQKSQNSKSSKIQNRSQLLKSQQSERSKKSQQRQRSNKSQQAKHRPNTKSKDRSKSSVRERNDEIKQRQHEQTSQDQLGTNQDEQNEQHTIQYKIQISQIQQPLDDQYPNNINQQSHIPAQQLQKQQQQLWNRQQTNITAESKPRRIYLIDEQLPEMVDVCVQARLGHLWAPEKEVQTNNGRSLNEQVCQANTSQDAVKAENLPTKNQQSFEQPLSKEQNFGLHPATDSLISKQEYKTPHKMNSGSIIGRKPQSHPKQAAITKQLYGVNYTKDSQQQSQRQLKQSEFKHPQIKGTKYIELGRVYRQNNEGTGKLFDRDSIDYGLVSGDSGVEGCYGLGNLWKVVKILCARNQYLIIRLFQNIQCTHSEYYGVWLCNNYIWSLYKISSNYRILVNEKQQPLYLHHRGLQKWMIVLFQALLHRYGGYQALQSANIGDLFRTLTGSNFVGFKIKQDPEKNAKFLKFITKNQKKNFIIVAQKRMHNSVGQSIQNNQQPPIYYILSQKTINGNQTLLRMKKNSSDPFWIKLQKFASEFSQVSILQLRVNHNFNYIKLQDCNKGHYQVVEMVFNEQSFGCVAAVTKSTNIADFAMFLYREEQDSVLRLVGQAREKAKKLSFFDCNFEQGKYYVFVDISSPQNYINYIGENKPNLRIKQQIEQSGLKSKYTQYIPVQDIPEPRQRQMPKFLNLTKKSEQGSQLGIQSGLYSANSNKKSRGGFERDRLREEFVKYLINS